VPSTSDNHSHRARGGRARGEMTDRRTRGVQNGKGTSDGLGTLCTRERLAFKDINTKLTRAGRAIPTRRNACDSKGQISDVTPRVCGAKQASCLGGHSNTNSVAPSGANMPFGCVSLHSEFGITPRVVELRQGCWNCAKEAANTQRGLARWDGCSIPVSCLLLYTGPCSGESSTKP
jgi:hypothetical protein